MDITIKKPSEVSAKEMHQILDLIAHGAQIQADYEATALRLTNAVFISFISEEDRIIATATIKNPAKNYAKKVFESAKAEELLSEYKYELGYIVTASGREGENLCQKLLTAFFPFIDSRKMYATTRKDAMIHILKKFGFRTAGEKYNSDLTLLIN
ncbi:hypothetical protein ACHRVK_03745 [Flavobacterium plurextorum]|uniref:hypothetical protein n=1 Tax=Flavobacterium plurextorum TaxID=1114867 RepID=UPI00375776A2